MVVASVGLASFMGEIGCPHENKAGSAAFRFPVCGGVSSFRGENGRPNEKKAESAAALLFDIGGCTGVAA